MSHPIFEKIHARTKTILVESEKDDLKKLYDTYGFKVGMPKTKQVYHKLLKEEGFVQTRYAEEENFESSKSFELFCNILASMSIPKASIFVKNNPAPLSLVENAFKSRNPKLLDILFNKYFNEREHIQITTLENGSEINHLDVAIWGTLEIAAAEIANP